MEKMDHLDNQGLPEDPRRKVRVTVGAVAAGALTVAAFGANSIALNPDGSHSTWFVFQPARILILLVLAALVMLLVNRPNKPDTRVARAGILAAALVAVVVGLNVFLVAIADPQPGAPETVAGPGAWGLIAAGFLLVYLRWAGSLWPESAWARQLGVA